MPQMSPLNWLSLYTIFTSTLILFCMINYYSYLPPALQKKASKKNYSKPLNWKW